MSQDYIPLANVTLGSSASSITFSNIPATYRDLILVVNGSPSTNDYPVVTSRFNSDTGANYERVRLGGSGSGSGGTSFAGGMDNLQLNSFFGLGSSSSSRFALISQVMDYSATNKHKTVLSRSGTNTDGVEALSGRWANSSAITTWQVYTSSAAFASGTIFALYGIVA